MVKSKEKKDFGVIINFFIWLHKKAVEARFNRMVKKAEKRSAIDGYVRFILLVGGSKRIVLRREIKRMIAKGRFKKGTRISDIEKKALYRTKNSAYVS